MRILGSQTPERKDVKIENEGQLEVKNPYRQVWATFVADRLQLNSKRYQVQHTRWQRIRVIQLGRLGIEVPGCMFRKPNVAMCELSNISLMMLV
jgi:hypothetical protein